MLLGGWFSESEYEALATARLLAVLMGRGGEAHVFRQILPLMINDLSQIIYAAGLGSSMDSGPNDPRCQQRVLGDRARPVPFGPSMPRGPMTRGVNSGYWRGQLATVFLYICVCVCV